MPVSPIGGEWARFPHCRFAKEQEMLTTLAYSASLPVIAFGLIVYVSGTFGLVF
jgi:hypothetical protein